MIILLVFGAIKKSDVYLHALAKVQASEEVRALLGEPIEPGFFVSGNISVSDSSGTADLAIPVSGPKGSATIHVVAKKVAGEWEYSTLEVAPRGSESRI